MKVGARDTAIALTSRVIVLLVSVGIQSVLARALGPDGRGSYAVCVLYATVLGTLFTLGIDLAGQYFAASGRMTRAESIGGAAVALGVCSILAVFTGRLLLETNIAFFAKADRSSFLISLAVVPTVIASGAGVAFLVGFGKFKWMVIVETANIVLQLAASLVLVMWLKLGVDGALWSIVLAGVGSSCLAAWFLARLGALARFSQSVEKYRALVSYGIRFVVAKLSTILHLRIGTLLIAFFVSPADIGLFATASVLVTQVLMIPIAVENALFSRVARHEAGRPELVARAVRVSTILCAVLLALLVLLSRLLVLVVLTPEFLPAVPLIAIMAPGILVRVGGRVMMTYFRGTDRPAICSWAVVAGIVVNMLCILAFLPAFGLPGAALAMTAGYLASSLVLGVAFKSATGQSFVHTWLPRRSDVATLVVVAQCLLRSRSQEEETSIPSE